MKSEVVTITNDPSSLETVLQVAEKVAGYNKLDAPSVERLRLLSEELYKMLPELLDIGTGSFWIETEGNRFALHAQVEAEKFSFLDSEGLLSLSTSGKNESTKSFLNKIAYMVRGMMSGAVDNMMESGNYGEGMYTIDGGHAMLPNRWAGHNADQDQSDQWDELERTLLEEIADEIKVGVMGRDVNVIVEKEF